MLPGVLPEVKRERPQLRPWVEQVAELCRPDEVVWWSKGGDLHGESPARIAFLRDVLNEAPPEGIEPIDKWQNSRMGGRAGQYYLLYFGEAAPTAWRWHPRPSRVHRPR